MPRHFRKGTLIAGAVLLVVLAGAVLAVEVVLPRMFVVPSRTHYNPAAPADTPLKVHLPFTAFDTRTSDGLTLKCWFVPASPQPAAGTVIILHGWGGSKEWVRELIELVVRNGWNAVAYDSRAHGASGGRYMSYGVREKDDVTAVLNQVEAQFKDAGPFGILGISYGGAVMMLISARRRGSGLSRRLLRPPSPAQPPRQPPPSLKLVVVRRLSSHSQINTHPL